MAETNETLQLTLLSPERQLVQMLAVVEVTLTGSEGQIQILPGHADMMGTLETGIFSYKEPSGAATMGVISTGFFEVKSGAVSVMAETAELKGEIDVGRAKKAQQLAEQTLSEADLEPEKFRKYQLKLQRALIRQHIAGDL
jgi:F-type H+-transporting ATPase subunit epsilon